MNIKEQIIAEIKRLKAEYNKQISSQLMTESLVSMGKVEALNEVIDFIDFLPEDEPSEDLEKMSKEYVKDVPTFKDSCIMKAAFEDGWLSCKEQMMKDAVEATITNNLAAYPVIYFDEVKQLGFKYGDKVKLIIAKED